MNRSENWEKMRYHVKKAEEWQAQVLKMEDDALAEVQTRPNPTQQSHLYMAARSLDDHFWYRRAVANRNSHQTQANMYGIAALLEAISFPQVVKEE